MKNKFLMFLCILAAVGCTNTKPKQPSEKISALTGKEVYCTIWKNSFP